MVSKNKTKRGDLASRKCSENQNKKKIIKLGKKIKMIYVIYKDHVFFRNCDSSKIKPHIREMVGWLCYENTEALCILSDKPVKPIKIRARKILESGFVILQSDILVRVYFNMGKNLKRLRKEVIQGANALKRRKKKNAKADHC